MYVTMQSNPLANLDLIDYACQDLMVSFAVANNEAGLSNFSPTTNVTIDIKGIRTFINLQYENLNCKLVL